MSILAAHEQRNLKVYALKSTMFVVQRRQSRPVLDYAFSDRHWYPSFSTAFLNRNLDASVRGNLILGNMFFNSHL